MSNIISQDLGRHGAFLRERLVRGQPTQIRCVEVAGQVFSITDGLLRIASLEDEWYEDIDDPERIAPELRALGADLFTFWQRMPDVRPRYDYHLEWDEIAALPITTYEDWWNTRIKSRIRTTIRKSQKSGLVVKEVPFDDQFIAALTALFNESPTRQGRKFWHYGKDFATVKAQFSRYVHRESMIAAFFEDKIVGLVMLGDAGDFALPGTILSSLHHWDKAPNNALIAKSVEVCANRGFKHLVYWYWSDDTLAEFKRRCGFEKVAAPRYFVPLSRKGAVALKTGAHKGIVNMIPPRLKHTLKRLRRSWYGAPTA